jgi:hypothetical protein
MGEKHRGAYEEWRPTTEFQVALVADMIERLEQHEREGTLPRSPRGLFYDLRPDGGGRGVRYVKYPPMQCARGGEPKPRNAGRNCAVHGGQFRRTNPMDASVDLVTSNLGLARRAGLVRESWIEDTRAPTPDVPSYDNETAEQSAAGWVNAILDPPLEYDPQEDQDTYLEVLVEAAGLISRMSRIAAPYGVPVYSGGGYDGIKGKRALGQRAAGRNVPTVVLRVTDYDDHGLAIAKASVEDSTAWAEGYYEADPGWLEFERIALTEQQAADNDLLDQFGKAEADGLPVPVMDQILTDAIESYQDPARRAETAQRAADERARIPGLIRELLNQRDT